MVAVDPPKYNAISQIDRNVGLGKQMSGSNLLKSGRFGIKMTHEKLEWDLQIYAAEQGVSRLLPYFFSCPKS